MAVRSGFFNAVNDDRVYDASNFAEYFATFIGNGVFPNPSNGLQVYANNNMTTVVKAGKGWINGYFVANDSDFIIAHDRADGVLKRIDRIVLRKSIADRDIQIVLKKGTYVSNPAAPAIVRDADYYELALADVLITNGAIQITQANITDQRFNKTLCGIVKGTIDEIDTTGLFAQYGKAFEEWFEQIQTELQGDVAANLQLQIDRLVRRMNSTAIQYGNDTGTANAKIVTLDNPPTSYFDGMAIAFKNKVENTGSVTINVDGLGVKTVKNGNGRTLSKGNLKANVPYTVRYNGMDFFLQGEGSEFDVGDKIPSSKVTAGYRSQWTATPVNYGGAAPTGVDKDGNIYMITNPDTRDGSVSTLAKYSPTGSLIKKITVSDPNRSNPSGVTVNGSYLAFYSYSNVFIYDLDLTLLTTIPLGTNQSGKGNKVAITTSGDVYVGVLRYNSSGPDAYEVRRYNRFGGLIWTKPVDNNAEIADIRLLSDGNIVIATAYGGYTVQKLLGSDGASVWTVALYSLHTPGGLYVSNMKNVVETSDGNIMVSYGARNGNYTPSRTESIVRTISPSGTPGGYIVINNTIGPQYEYPVYLCTDGNGGVYFGVSGDFYWRETTNDDMANINYNIFGRLNKNLQLIWNHIFSQGRTAWGDGIWALTYDPLFDSVIASQSQGAWSYGVIRKWDWYVSLK